MLRPEIPSLLGCHSALLWSAETQEMGLVINREWSHVMMPPLYRPGFNRYKDQDLLDTLFTY
jgi:hypothetical protein